MKIIHPPDLWHALHGDIDTETLDFGEVVKEDEVSQRTVRTGRTTWSSRELGVWFIAVASHRVTSNASKLPDAVRTQRITTDGGSNSIEAVATVAQVWAVCNLSGSTIFTFKWEVVVASNIDGALSLKLQNQWRRVWDEWNTWWWTDSKPLGEVEVLVRAEYWQWLVNITNKRRDIVELLLVSTWLTQKGREERDLR